MPTRREFLKSAAALAASSRLPVVASAQQPATSEVFADFESGTYEGWTLTGNCWTKEPHHEKTVPGITGFQGKRFLCTLHPTLGTNATGKAASRKFTIEKPFINFLIGGGNHPGEACLNLVVDGKVVRTETGYDSAELRPTGWDLSAFIGKKGYIEILDNTISKERGYIMVDAIKFTERIDFGNLPYQNTATEMTARWRRDFGLPGVWCAFIKDGRVQACVASGTRKIGENLPARVIDHLPIGSVSKVISGSMIAFFVVDGIITYETTLGAVFPDLRSQHGDSPLLKATLRNLMTHSAGLPRGPDASFDVSGPDYRLNTLKKYLADPRVQLPNITCLYSNQGVPIAVAMVERLSGTTFESWLYGQIGKKIGLTDPHQLNSHPNEAFPHVLENGVARLGSLETIKPRGFAPQGAYSLNLSDICAFSQFTLTNSAGLPEKIYRQNVIGPSPGQPAQEDTGNGQLIPNRARTDSGWAFNDANQYLMHAGMIGGHYTQLFVSPGMRRAFVFYTNCVENGMPFMKAVGKDISDMRFMK